MKNVLIISYFFPPLGGPGVQRIAKFVKYLPDFGWNPIVLTVKNIEYIAYDKTLEKEVKKAEIHRTESLDLMRFLYLFEKIRSKPEKRIYETADTKLRNRLRDIFPIDPKIGWSPFAVKKGIDICRTKKIDLIFATILPYTSSLVGYQIAKQGNLPLILDYRDLWQGKPDISYCSKWHFRFSNYWEKKMLTYSSHNIMNTKRANEKIQPLYPAIPKSHFSVLYNGFDKQDFQQKNSRKTNQLITFTYTGGFYGERTPLYFFQAVRELQQAGKLAANIRFRFVGNYLKSIYEMAEKIDGCIEFIPQVSHQKCIEYLLASDFLLLFIAKRNSEIVIPAKLFEYLAANKPILAMLPLQGEAAELIRELKAGLLTEIDDVEQIKKYILQLCNLPKEKRDTFQFPAEKINPFERKKQTEQLAEIFYANCK
jgi:glycosyltransferase involved in cell wall biosynthesis